MNYELENKALSRAKIQLMTKRESTFFTTVCLSLDHRFTEKIEKAESQGMSISFNPEYFMSLDTETQTTLLLRESLHTAYMHGIRRGMREPVKWTVACHNVVNLQLKERGFHIPHGWPCDSRFGNMSVEEVYELLELDEQNQNPPPPPPMMDIKAPGEGEDPGNGDNGPEGQGPSQGMTQEQIQRKMEDIMVKAATQAKMNGDSAGSIPGNVQLLLQKLLDPKLPWHQILRKYLSKYRKNDYSFRKPNRRFFPQHYLPSLHSESLMDLCVAVDISGSVSDEDFNSFAREIHGILKHFKPEKITLIQFDTQIQNIDVLKRPNDIYKVEFRGRGGTDPTPVIEWAKEHRPQVLFFFTDGEFYCNFEDPKLDTVWLIHNNPRFEAPFGKLISYEMVH